VRLRFDVRRMRRPKRSDDHGEMQGPLYLAIAGSIAGARRSLNKRWILDLHSPKRRSALIWLLIASVSMAACAPPGHGIESDQFRHDQSHSVDISVARPSTLSFSQARIARIQLKNGCSKKTVTPISAAKVGLPRLTESWLLVPGLSRSYLVDLGSGLGRSPPFVIF
jgi:hypothetical protein